MIAFLFVMVVCLIATYKLGYVKGVSDALPEIERVQSYNRVLCEQLNGLVDITNSCTELLEPVYNRTLERISHSPCAEDGDLYG